MDNTTAISAAAPADKPITAADYHTLGRRQAEFWASQAEAARKSGTDKISLGFKDLVDLINPFQHIPIISNIYQAVTGDNDIKPAVKLVGDTMFGGPLAAVSSGVDAIVKQASGKDMLETAMSWFSGDDAKATAVAANGNTASPAAPVQTASNAAAPSANPTLTNPAAATAVQPAINIPKYGLASTGTGSVTTPAAGPAQQVAAAPPSAFFNGLQKNGATGSKMPMPAKQNAYFNPKSVNPVAQQFTGLTPASLKGLTDNSAGVGSAAMPASGMIIPASVSANATLASSSVMQDTAQNPQSDFAKKMMSALDRYQASQKMGDGDAAPATSMGM